MILMDLHVETLIRDLEIYVHYGDCEDPRICSPLKLAIGLERISNSRAPLSFFAQKYTSIDVIGVLFIETDQVLLLVRLYFLPTYALFDLTWNP